MEEKKLKQRPDFATEDEEREFWATHEIGDYFDLENMEVISEPGRFPNLKLTEDLVSFKIPLREVEHLKSAAKKHHVTPDDLARKYVLDGLKKELKKRAA